MSRIDNSSAIASAVVCALTWITGALAQSPCAPSQQDTFIQATVASAGFFDNLRNSDDSIRYQMDHLLSLSESRAHELRQHMSPCRSPSCGSPVIAVVFTSTPNLTLPEYEDFPSCQKLLEATRQQPIVYKDREFNTQEEAKEWYNDLTQGDGTDGENLYDRCPGQCSPSYSSVIYRARGKFLVTTSIICGHARDRDDNQYRLSSSLRWICL
ncbi:MAG: hypothetical protein RIS36_1445 [Pseudomonadota bacterium]|jgi:hypothetical protein